jgi:hypothetical protein
MSGVEAPSAPRMVRYQGCAVAAVRLIATNAPVPDRTDGCPTVLRSALPLSIPCNQSNEKLRCALLPHSAHRHPFREALPSVPKKGIRPPRKTLPRNSKDSQKNREIPQNRSHRAHTLRRPETSARLGGGSILRGFRARSRHSLGIPTVGDAIAASAPVLGLASPRPNQDHRRRAASSRGDDARRREA